MAEQTQSRSPKNATSKPESSKAPAVIRKVGGKGVTVLPKTTPESFQRGKMTTQCHTFKGETANATKVSKYNRPMVDTEVGHGHYFHSTNSQGRVQKTCVPTAGHVHEFEFSVDPVTGQATAKCGPPLKRVVVRHPDGKQTVEWQRIKFKDPHKRGQFIEDNHTHNLLYVGWENMSAERVKAIQDENRKDAGNPGQVIDTSPPPNEPIMAPASSPRDVESDG